MTIAEPIAPTTGPGPDPVAGSGPGVDPIARPGAAPDLPQVPLPAALAPVWNAALSFAGSPLPLARGAIRFEAADAPVPGQRLHRLALQQPGERARCEVLFCPTGFPFQEGYGAGLTLDEVDALPDALAEALHDGVRDKWLSALEGPLALRAEGTTTTAAADPRGEVLWYDAVLEGVLDAPCQARVGIRPRSLAAWLSGGGEGAGHGLALERGRLRHQGLAERLTLPASITVGRLTLPIAELAHLAPGDVLLTGTQAEAPRHEILLARLRITVETGEGGLTVTARESIGISDGPQAPKKQDEAGQLPGEGDEVAEHDTAEGSAEERAVETLGGPVVDLDLEVARVEVPLTALESWTEGSVVPLEIPADEAPAITVRLNGRAIASGTLVRLEDRLAVQITDVLL
ncbi:MAG: FliM/FliN family flagellar motor switch protein [Pseudomonadota bacterium]